MIDVKNLGFSYDDKNVLHDISFSVNKGELFAILGPNGTGKTTLINILTGKLEIQRGSVCIMDTCVNDYMSTDAKKKIGVMRDITGLYTKMTGYEYLRFVATLYGYPADKIASRISSLTEKYGLITEIDRQIKKYSAGTKKKLEFCAAIIHEAKLLFLDEPFESVDPQITYEIKKFLREYVEFYEATVVITSHILDTIQNLCSNYIIINNGYVARQGIIIKNMEPRLEDIYLDVVGYMNRDDNNESTS